MECKGTMTVGTRFSHLPVYDVSAHCSVIDWFLYWRGFQFVTWSKFVYCGFELCLIQTEIVGYEFVSKQQQACYAPIGVHVPYPRWKHDAKQSYVKYNNRGMK